MKNFDSIQTEFRIKRLHLLQESKTYSNSVNDEENWTHDITTKSKRSNIHFLNKIYISTTVTLYTVIKFNNVVTEVKLRY